MPSAFCDPNFRLGFSKVSSEGYWVFLVSSARTACASSSFFASALALSHAAQDAHGVDALVHVQAHGVHFKAGALGLARPLQIGRAHALQGLQRMAHGSGVVTGQGIGNQRIGLGTGAVKLECRV